MIFLGTNYNLVEVARLKIRYLNFPGARDIQHDLELILQQWEMNEERLSERENLKEINTSRCFSCIHMNPCSLVNVWHMLASPHVHNHAIFWVLLCTNLPSMPYSVFSVHWKPACMYT